jgi:P-type Mg2+ transporter
MTLTTDPSIETPAPTPQQWRSAELSEVLKALEASEQGLSEAAAAARLRSFGSNSIVAHTRRALVTELALRFGNPLILLLLAASLIAAVTGDTKSALIIVLVVSASVLLDFFQEHRAERTVERLRASVTVHCSVLREGATREIPVYTVVPGDVVLLTAGDLVPADGIVLDARHLFVNQAALTGESYPVDKVARTVSAADPEEMASSTVFMGTSVVSGSGRMLVAATGARTEFGKIAGTLARRRPPDPLERGTRQFGLLILRLTLLLSLMVLLINMYFHRPPLESFMFALALAVGLAPELLPMIVSVTLASGAMQLAKKRVVVKRLAAVYALGSIDVICTDKTGTLTEGRLQLAQHIDARGVPSERVQQLAHVNSVFESGIRSPLDEAIIAHGDVDMQGWTKLDELPFDFERRSVSVLVQTPGPQRLLIVKGAPEDMFARCSVMETGDGSVAFGPAERSGALRRFEELSAQGLRTIAVATRTMPLDATSAAGTQDAPLTLVGLLAFIDPPRPDAAHVLTSLRRDGIEVKILSGDNEHVVEHLCAALGLEVKGIVLGSQLQAMDELALAAAAQSANLFCRVTPGQKERILRALKLRGHTVGFIGDGINDAPALHIADVGISVDSAVDVAKEAADVILVRHDLMVLHRGVQEGRRTYSNIMKYLMMATSSNFGNMASMAIAPIVLPFLPLLPVQVLLNNLLYDVSEIAIPLDRVERSSLAQPQRWDMKFIRNFMLTMGPLSSVFDLLTFYVLLVGLSLPVDAFRTGWFVESIATQVLVIFVIRTRGNPLSHWPHPLLTLSSLAVVIGAAVLPYLPIGAQFGLVPLPGRYFVVLGAIVCGYLLLAEAGKRIFYRRFAPSTAHATSGN